FFVQLLNVLHLGLPGAAAAPIQGEAFFALDGSEIPIREFELNGGGLRLSGKGRAWLDGRLDLQMVAVGAPEEAGPIPLVSTVVDRLLQLVESELVRLDVSGTIDDPVFKHRVLSKITRPVTSLRAILFSPLFGGGGEGAEQ
ncbi:MAG: hypothetical protein PVJ27_10020, partial [Candidatus Brocadiaceae bacterium]